MMRSRLHLPRHRALLAAAVLALAVPATAQAATAGYASGTITFTGAAGEANHVVVQPWGLGFKLTDTGVKGKPATAIALIAGSGCWQLASNSALCPGTATLLNANLGDGDDFFDASLVAIPEHVSGVGGNDDLRGGLGADTLDGGGGNDTFEARDLSADTLACGAGTDSGNADALDTIPGDCESVAGGVTPTGTIAPVTPVDPTAPITDPLPVDPAATPTDPLDPTPDTDPGTTPQRTVTPAANAVPASIPAQTVSVSASGVASVKVVCPADSGGCRGTVTLELPNGAAVKGRGKLVAAKVARGRARAPLTIGRSNFKAAAGTAPIVRVRLSKRGRQRIVKGRRGRARIVVTTRKADGTTSVATQNVTIRAKRTRRR
jgi:hypothetical protein